MTTTHDEDLDGRIAIIGMAARVPGAPDIATFWDNLRNGVESIRTLDEDELLAAHEPPDLIADPAYVRAAAPLEHFDHFDAGLFNLSPRDAAIFDPQHRIFLELAYQTFEHAGYIGEGIEGAVGVFASCGASEYMFKNVLGNHHIATTVGEWLIRHTGNDQNFLATRVSYEFDLQGPSMNVQTACSSTLVAVHLACQSILSGECDMALAGGAVVAPVQHRGYVYKEGEILSPDGHCRPFDAASAGTVISSAAGCVLLKSLDAALADGDTVLAVIRGSAINNDGRDKVGYLAPSVSGQARVVAEALAVSGVDARDVTYVEAHGTGTLIGDPIEMAGLTEAFRQTTDDRQFCAIGSLKSNIGHAGEAAGIAALIKTVLSLQHREIPPSLHYRSPNPQIDFADSPFHVNATLTPWEANDRGTRIAGVTGLGAGGTNAHVIVEEAPMIAPSPPGHRSWQLVTVSARSDDAADRAVADLAGHLRRHPGLDLADVAFTRLAGRRAFRARRAVVAEDTASAAALLERADAASLARHHHRGAQPTVVFMVPGGGAQYAGMGRDLYESEPVFRDTVDECAAFVNPQLGFDLRTLLYPAEADSKQANRTLEQPSAALPALFTTALAMARLLESWGIRPSAMIGHSAGEYVAACLAGVVSVHDALAMVALRGRLFETLPSGSMLSVSLSEADALDLVPAGLSIAAVNAAELCVVSGPTELIRDLEQTLVEQEIGCSRVHIDVAAHSSMLDPILAEFEAFCRSVRFSPPTIPYVSNLTGAWATAEDVTDVRYWVRHLREPVRFADGIATILDDPDRVLVEIGPGRTLAGLARLAGHPVAATTATIRHPDESASDVAFLLRAVARAWTAGVDLDPELLFEPDERRRVPLPTYPFERQRYWVDPDVDTATRPVASMRKRPDVASWFTTPAWRLSVARRPEVTEPGTTVVISRGSSLATSVAQRLAAAGERVVDVTFGDRYEARAHDRFVVDPSRPADWDQLVDLLRDRDIVPDRILHVSAVGTDGHGLVARTRRLRAQLGRADLTAEYERTLETDHTSLVFLARSMSGLADSIRLVVVTSGAESVDGTEVTRPDRAMLHGACRVIPRELGHVRSAAVDVDVPDAASDAERTLAGRLVDELFAGAMDDVVAYRRGRRWTRSFEPVELPPTDEVPWLDDGVYLITGGLGGIGLSIAEHIAANARRTTLVLIGRTQLPPEHMWRRVLADEATEPTVRRRIADVERLRGLGAEVVVAVADVTDLAQITAVVDDVRRRFGPPTGVVHSAGILRDALIALRTPSEHSAVIDIKARGVLNLDRALASDPPALMVLCSSVSSIIGLPGQIDYTAANAYLDAYAKYKDAEGRTRTVTVNWSAWQEVGMAVDALQVTAERAVATEVAPISPTHLFDEVEDTGTVVELTARMSRRRNWLLDDHAVRGGQSLIPGTGFVELIRSATAVAAQPGPIELRDVFFLSTFGVGDMEERTLRITVDRSSDAVSVHSDLASAPHAIATARRVEPEPAAAVDLDAVRRRCTVRREDFDGFSDQPFMRFGPRWGNLRSIDYGTDEALITTVMPDQFAPEVEDLWYHPGVLDIAIGSAQALVPGFDQASTFYVPFSYSRILVRGPVPTHAVTHIRCRPTSAPDLAVFDAVVHDEDGRPVIEIDGFTMRRVADGSGLAEIRPDFGPDDRPITRSPIESAMRQGIMPAEGVDALDRLLVADLGPQVAVSSIDLAAWTASVDAEARDADVSSTDDGSTAFARPDLASDFVAPRTPIERELSAMWSELLGIRAVGRDDDFFDLGGQSLIAVRLFTRMRKRYSVDLALSTLFEAPTIAQCARIVADKLGIADEPDEPVDGAVTDAPSTDATVPAEDRSDRSRRRSDGHGFRSLVTIQRGGDRIPFFCVHGAGGNVLNFRDLSLAMGHNQPFYGLQARGVDGVLRPHVTIEEMATAYLDEVRSVQPHGPYIFGGYSGGGLVAFEMARQVGAAGEPVALVILLDTFPPVIEFRRTSMRSTLDRLRTERLDYLKHIVSRRVEVRRRAQERARLDGILATDAVVPTELREMHLEDNFGAAAERYIRHPWEGRAVLMRAEDVAFAFQDLGDSYGWAEVIGAGFELIRVPGGHNTLVLEPNASTLVARIRAILDDCMSDRVDVSHG